MTYLTIPQLSQEQAEKFWSQYEEAENGCLEWQGMVAQNGYGKTGIGAGHGGKFLAHRVAYSEHNGGVPNDELVLHSCDNRKCGRKEHLHLGTHKDNTREMIERGRQSNMDDFFAKNPGIIEKWKAEGKWKRSIEVNKLRSGEKSNFAKLTEDDIRTIRKRCSNGEYQFVVAADYDITQSNVSCIVRRISWNHVE